jgi:hypothetical protein
LIVSDDQKDARSVSDLSLGMWKRDRRKSKRKESGEKERGCRVTKGLRTRTHTRETEDCLPEHRRKYHTGSRTFLAKRPLSGFAGRSSWPRPMATPSAAPEGPAA